MRRNAYATAAGRGGGRRLRSKVLRSPQKPPRHPRRPRNKRRIGPLLEYLEHSGGHRAALVVEGGCSVADDSGKETHRHYSRRESWTFIVPVGNLSLTNAASREFRVEERVTLVHKDRLPYVRKKHGLGMPVSELKKKG
jgi:hypothetical protein